MPSAKHLSTPELVRRAKKMVPEQTRYKIKMGAPHPQQKFLQQILQELKKRKVVVEEIGVYASSSHREIS